MTVAHASPDTPQQPAPAAAGPDDLRSVAAAILVSTFGVLVVVAGYAVARAHTGNAIATTLFWVGQIVIFGPLVLFSCRRRSPSNAATAALVVTLGVVPYVVKVAYSPTRLTFTDELQHRFGVEQALQTGRLGSVNDALPIAADFPGLESMSAALTSMTGLRIDVAALIVAGMLKLFIVVAVALFLRELTGSNQLTAIGVLIYAANGNFEFFSAFFVYGTAAFPLAIVTIYLALVLRRAERRRGLLVLCALASTALTVVTHHATALFLSALLVLAAFWAVIRRRRFVESAIVLAVFSSAFTVIWFTVAAPSIGTYLDPYFSVNSEISLDTDVPLPDRIVATPRAPLPDLFFNRLGLTLTVLLVIGGALLMLRRNVTADWSRSWRFTMAVVGLSLIGSSLIAIALPFGIQAATRALIFTYLGAAVFGSLAVAWALDRGWRFASAGATVVVLLCIVGGLEFGWPPWWEKLPGTYQPDGYESGVDPRVLTATAWVKQNLPANSPFAGDANGLITLETLANMNAIRDGAPIFYDKTITKDDRTVLGNRGIRYLWVDRRIALQVSPSSRYYSGSLGVQYTFRPPLDGLTKWGRVPGVSTLYSDGTITIYDLKGSSLYG